MSSAEGKILIVDDDELVRECFERILGRHFTLETASGGAEALDAIASRGPFAVLVSDMRMPGLGGVELIFKTKELSPDTVCILLSGNVDRDLDSGENGAIYKVIEKPCPYDVLTQILKDALTHHHELRAEN